MGLTCAGTQAMFGTAANYSCPGPTEAPCDTAAQSKMGMASFPD